MIEKMTGVPAGVDGLHVTGWLFREDYDVVVRPMLDEAIREGRGIRALIYVDHTFDGLTLPALWADIRLGLRALRHWTGCAVVTDQRWLRNASWLVAAVVPWPVRVFGEAEFDRALDWLRGLPERSGPAADRTAEAA